MIQVKLDNDQTFQVELKDGRYFLNEVEMEISILKKSNFSWNVLYKGKSMKVQVDELNADEKKVTLSIEGKKIQAELSTELDLMLKKLGMEKGAGQRATDVKAPMPGLIHSIDVAVGAEVKKGDPLLILEAMKMENVIKSPADGVVGKIHVEAKSTVEKGAVLLTFD